MNLNKKASKQSFAVNVWIIWHVEYEVLPSHNYNKLPTHSDFLSLFQSGGRESFSVHLGCTERKYEWIVIRCLHHCLLNFPQP